VRRPLVLMLVLVSFLAAPALADTLLFNSPSGNLGSATHTYTFGSATVTATAFNCGTGCNLYGKNNGGNEIGLGLTGDPSTDDEIWVKSSGTQDFIQLNVSGLLAAGYTNIKFEMNSTTNGEGWSVSACSVSGVDCGSSPVIGGTQSIWISLPGNTSAINHYLDFTATGSAGSNVLLEGITATAPVPEPSSLMMFGSGLATLSGFARRYARNRR